jgi:thioredoxin reductase
MAQAVLLAVDNHPDIITALQRDLTRRFAADYRIVTGGRHEATALEGQPAFVVGGANSAGQAAVHLARFASVTLLVRGPSLSDRMSAYLINELERASNVGVWPNTTVIGV